MPFQLVQRAHADTHHWAASSWAACPTACAAPASSAAAAITASWAAEGGGVCAGSTGAPDGVAARKASSSVLGCGADGAGAGGGDGVDTDGAGGAAAGRALAGGAAAAAPLMTSLPRVAATAIGRPNACLTVSSSVAKRSSSISSRLSISVSRAAKGVIPSMIEAGLSVSSVFGSFTVWRRSFACAWHWARAAKRGSSAWLTARMRSSTVSARFRVSVAACRFSSAAMAATTACTTGSSFLRPSISPAAGAATDRARAASRTPARMSTNSRRADASTSGSDSGGSVPETWSSRAAWPSAAARLANRLAISAR